MERGGCMSVYVKYFRIVKCLYDLLGRTYGLGIMTALS